MNRSFSCETAGAFSLQTVQEGFRAISREDLLSARVEFGLGDTTHQLIRSIAGDGADRVQQPSTHDVNIDAVRSGLDVRTSLMLRDLPTSYTQQMLLSEFMEVFSAHIKSRGCSPSDPKFAIEFFYLPFNLKRQANNGYAFLSVTTTECVAAVYEAFYGYRFVQVHSSRYCKVSYSKVQGKALLVNQFNPENIMRLPEICRPVVPLPRDTGYRREEMLLKATQKKALTVPDSASSSWQGDGIDDLLKSLTLDSDLSWVLEAAFESPSLAQPDTPSCQSLWYTGLEGEDVHTRR